MMLLETYTTLSPDELKLRLPDFLKLGPEVTGEPAFSMYNLTLKGGWIDNANFCHKLSDDKEDQERQAGTICTDIDSFILDPKILSILIRRTSMIFPFFIFQQHGWRKNDSMIINQGKDHQLKLHLVKQIVL